MKYKGYTITAEIETYEQWSLDDEGSLDEHIGDNDGFDISGYHFDNEESGDSLFHSMSDTDFEMLRDIVDSHIKELAS